MSKVISFRISWRHYATLPLANCDTHGATSRPANRIVYKYDMQTQTTSHIFTRYCVYTLCMKYSTIYQCVVDLSLVLALFTSITICGQ